MKETSLQGKETYSAFVRRMMSCLQQHYVENYGFCETVIGERAPRLLQSVNRVLCFWLKHCWVFGSWECFGVRLLLCRLLHGVQNVWLEDFLTRVWILGRDFAT